MMDGLIEFCSWMKLDPREIGEAIDRDLKKIDVVPKGGYKIAALTRGASNRGYLRVRFDNTGKGSLYSLVVMVLADPDPHKGIEEVADYADLIKELPFVNVLKHFRACGVMVPELHYYNVPAGLLYMEDFGDVLLRHTVVDKPKLEQKRMFEKAIDELVKLQVESTRRPNPDFIGFHMKFDHGLLRWELDHFTEYAVQHRFPGKPTPAESEIINRHFEVMTKDLLGSPYVVQHRDYHMDNLLIQEGAIKVIDFQDALMGPFTYDLACLLFDRDTSTVLGWELIDHLVDYYAEQYQMRTRKPLDPRLYHRAFDLCVLHRMLKVVGRFYFIQIVKKRDDFLAFIPHMLPAIKKYMGKYPEFRELQEVIAGYIPEVAL